MADYSDQEIDLRPYVTAVMDKWVWILGMGIIAAVLGFVVSSLMAPTYEATALVAITEPRQRVQFDSRIQTVNDTQPLKAYPELALSDALLVDLLDQLPEAGDITLVQLRSKLEAEPGTDPSLLKLTANDGSPEMAARLANSWAGLFVIWANEIYGDQGDEQLLFFEAQLAEAGEELRISEQALIEFQATNRSSILLNQLLAVQQTQADYLAKQRQTDLILQDVGSLLTEEGNNSTSGQARIEQLASILLQVRALGGVANSVTSTMPWQIQMNVDSQSSMSQEELRTVLSNLQSILLAQSSQIEERLAEIEPQILSVQQQKQAADVEESRLRRDFDVATETYTTLARTVDEKRITSEDTTSGVKLASETAVPEEPSGPRRGLITLLAGLLGMLVGTLFVLVAYVRSGSGSSDGQTV